MSIYYVYRSHYDLPAGKHVEIFEGDDLLSWMQSLWAESKLPEMLAIPGYLSLCDEVQSTGAVPESIEDLSLALNGFQNGTALVRGNYIRLSGFSDGMSYGAYYLFNDKDLKKRKNQAAFLVHKGWKLPTEATEGKTPIGSEAGQLKPNGTGKGHLYLALDVFYEEREIPDTTNCFAIVGARLPDLPRYLLTVQPDDYWPEELSLIRAEILNAAHALSIEEHGFYKAIEQETEDEEHWAIYSDWLTDHDLRSPSVTLLERALKAVAQRPVKALVESWDLYEAPATYKEATEQLAEAEKKIDPEEREQDPSKSLIEVEDHVAQICLHVGEHDQRDCYHRWILFDDLWAAAHPEMARELCIYVENWGVIQ